MGFKKIVSELRIVILGALAAGIIKIIEATIRWERVGFAASVPKGNGPHSVVFAFWHGRMLMAPANYHALRRGHKKNHRGYMLISRHGDGRIIALAVRLLGIRSVAGSSSRGGMAAVRELLRKSEEGGDIGITPDGPRGPRHVCKEGIVTVGQLSGMPIYPFSYSTERCWRLKSWDGMIIPRPFTRGLAMVGAPLVISREEDPEAARLRIQEVLNELTKQADNYWSAPR